MSYFKARQLLVKAAGIYQRQKESYTHKEILEKINQIKYMSAQKKVSRLSIRKEIVLLENKISGLFELDRRVERRKQEESARINALKRQIEMLKKRLISAQCPELQKKVETLSHLLGDFLAKQVTEEEIALSQKLVEELQKKPKVKAPEIKVMPPKTEVPPDPHKIIMIQEKIQQLKDEVQFNPFMDEAKRKSLEDKIKLLEEKFSKYAPTQLQTAPVETSIPKKNPAPSEAPSGKHDILFSLSSKIIPKKEEEDLEIERKLPLPPPPRMK